MPKFMPKVAHYFFMDMNFREFSVNCYKLSYIIIINQATPSPEGVA